MKIVLLTHGKVNPTGHNGISRVVYNLNKYQKMAGIESEIWSVVDNNKNYELYKRDEYVSIHCFPRISLLLGKMNLICKKLIEEKDTIDLVHFHMPWLPDKLIISKLCMELKIPYIVTGHSAYSRSQKQTWRMKIGKLYELPFLNSADAVHAITREESTEFRQYGINTKLFVIPNSIEDPYEKYKLKDFKNNQKINFFFMGELRAQKNIDGLIKAVSLLSNIEREELIFLIAGPDSNGNMKKLKDLAIDLNVQEQFLFLGGVFDSERERYFKKSDIYITPSHSEVISLSAIEAMAYGLPCLFTRQSDVSYYYDRDFFVMCENDAEDIARGIKEIISKKKKWSEMSINSRKVYEENFIWTNNVQKFIEIYKSIINKEKLWK